MDVVHGHDWEGAPALLCCDTRYADDPIVGGRRVADVPQPRLPRLGAARGRAAQLDLPRRRFGRAEADGVDLLREGIGRADMVNTVSPGSPASR